MPGKNSAIELHPQALFFEIESPYVAQPGLNLVTLLPFKCRVWGLYHHACILHTVLSLKNIFMSLNYLVNC
jgi:hypothetical protein